MQRSLLPSVVAIVCFGLISDADADTPRGRFSFLNANGKYEFKMVSRTRGAAGYSETWSLIDVETGQKRYTLRGQFAGKIVVVSSDGLSLAVLDYFCSGEPDLSRVVVTFYRDSKFRK